MLKGIIKTSASEKITGAALSKIIKDQDCICCVNDVIHIKNENGIWNRVSENDAIVNVRSMFADKAWQNILTTAKIRDILKNFKTDPDLQKSEEEFTHSDLIRLCNGAWSISNNSFISSKNNIYFRDCIDATVMPELGKESPEFIKYCRSVFSTEKFAAKKQALYEMIGFALSNIIGVKKCCILLGPPDCGKSLIANFITRLVGETNVSNVSLDNFGHRFSIAEMQNRSLNISAEIPTSIISGKALDTFKAITGGDRIQIERKGCQPVSAVINTKLLFAGNVLPVFNKVDCTFSLVKRFHILIFDKSVSGSNIDRELGDKLWRERDMIVRYALEALHNFILRNKEFILLEDEQSILETIRSTSNPLEAFIKSRIEFGKDYFVHITMAYEAYKEFAAEEGLPDISRIVFRNMMVMQSGIKIGKTKKRIGTGNPKSCFEGIRLRDLSYIQQDTEKSDDKEECDNG